jgi:hypothetical protein
MLMKQRVAYIKLSKRKYEFLLNELYPSGHQVAQTFELQATS